MSDALTYIAADSGARSELADVWRLAGFEFFNVTDSTQEILRALAEAGAPAWTLVAADHQTAGRGRQGRRWDSLPGSSLMFSLLLRPSDPGTTALLPIRAGLAVADELEALLHECSTSSIPRVGLKWPNDLIVDDGKIGGILCEGQIRGDEVSAIVGIGINVHPFTHTVSRDRPPAPTFLNQSDRQPVTRLKLLDRLIRRLRTALETDRETLSDAELAAYRKRDWLRGRLLAEPIPGRAAGIDDRGRLLVEQKEGIPPVPVVAGSVVTA